MTLHAHGVTLSFSKTRSQSPHQFQPKQEFKEQLGAAGIWVRSLAGEGKRYTFGAASNRGPAILSTIAFLISLLFLWGFYIKADDDRFFAVAIMGVITLIFLYSAVESWFGSREIEINKKYVLLKNSLLGIQTRFRRINLDAIEKVDYKSNSRKSMGIRFRTANGEIHTISLLIGDITLAIELARDMTEVVNRIKGLE